MQSLLPKSIQRTSASSGLRLIKPASINASRHFSNDKPDPSTPRGRWAYTMEICVSKVFPAGFCWQAASVIADAQLGLAADSAAFAVCTGLGDMTGVVVGHMVYKNIQKQLTGRAIDMDSEMKTATWLGGGAFCAGTSWQPAVDMLHDTMHLGFTPTFMGVTAICGGMFLAGLRAGRKVLPWMPSADRANFKQDMGLSLSIGGATGMFVATDPSFVGGQVDGLYRLTAPVFNITAAHTTIQGCITAGSSTLTGFGVFNSAQNILLPSGSNWMDNNNPFCEESEEEETDEMPAV